LGILFSSILCTCPKSYSWASIVYNIYK
jgi:hypothetical protein